MPQRAALLDRLDDGEAFETSPEDNLETRASSNSVCRSDLNACCYRFITIANDTFCAAPNQQRPRRRGRQGRDTAVEQVIADPFQTRTVEQRHFKHSPGPARMPRPAPGPAASRS
jgi:hypothetical protein